MTAENEYLRVPQSRMNDLREPLIGTDTPARPGPGDFHAQELLAVANYVAAASSQLDLALLEARQPAESLGSAISAITSVTHGWCASGEVERWRYVTEHLRRSVESLQFFDRLTQHVMQVSAFLVSITGRISQSIGDEEMTAGRSRAGKEFDGWNLMRERLRAQLISDAQRELLDLLLPPEKSCPQFRGRPARSYGAPGSVELF